MDQRPERQAPPEVFYNAQEAARYNQAADSIQADLTRQSLRLLGLLPRTRTSRPLLLLDVGCGSGLSGRVCQQHGVHWVGMDISPHMLEIASNTHLRKMQTISNGVRGDHHQRCQGLILADMGHKLPLAPACTTSATTPLFDAAISISAVQWLLFRPDWWEASVTFFTGLRKMLVPGALAVLQLYVLREHELIKLVHAARVASFAPAADAPSAPTTHVNFCSTPLQLLRDGFCQAVADFPHSNAARKYSLILRSPPIYSSHPQHGTAFVAATSEPPSSASAPTTALVTATTQTHSSAAAPTTACQDQATCLDEERGATCGSASPSNSMPLHPVGPVLAPECPLAWHVGGTCTVWWARQLHALEQGSTSSEPTHCVAAPHGPGSKETGNDDANPEAHCLRQHHTHARKLARLLQRAVALPAAPPGQLSPCAAANFSPASNSDRPPPPGPGQGRKRGAASRQPPPPPPQHPQPEGERLPHALRQWRTKHTDCKTRVGQPTTRLTALVDCPRLFPCHGHTCVAVLDHTSSLFGAEGWDEGAVRQLVAKMCDVDENQVHSVKVEVLEAAKRTDTLASTTHVQPQGNGSSAPAGITLTASTALCEQPLTKKPHTEAQTKQEPMSAPDNTMQQGSQGVMFSSSTGGDNVNGGGGGGGGGHQVPGVKGKGRGPKACDGDHQDKASLSDAYLGAQVSYWKCYGPNEDMLVATGTLQAPGVFPPYCVMDVYWNVPVTVPLAQASVCGSDGQMGVVSQGTTGAPADMQAGEEGEQQLSCQPMLLGRDVLLDRVAGRVRDLLLGVTSAEMHGSVVDASGGGAGEVPQPDVGLKRGCVGGVSDAWSDPGSGRFLGPAGAVEAVVMVLRETDSVGGGYGGPGVSCQLMVGVWDVSSSYGLPELMVKRCMEKTEGPSPGGEGQIQGLPKGDGGGAGQSGGEGESQVWVLKQKLALAKLNGRVERHLMGLGWPDVMAEALA